jgi:hypothetical protein
MPSAFAVFRLRCRSNFAAAPAALRIPLWLKLTYVRTDLNQEIFVTSDMVMHEPVKSRLYGAGELSGVGTMICGLRLPPPASVAADGIVASLNAGPVMVARPGIGAIVTLLPKASVASVVLATSLRAPVVTDVPKEEIAGAVAPGGSCGASIPVVGSALLALTVVLGAAAAIPVVGHGMTVPMAAPEIVAAVPGMNWIAPSGLAPGVGMVPGTLDVVGVVGDVMPDAGALRVDVVLTCCASVELQPNNTMAAVMRTKLRIGGSCA